MDFNIKISFSFFFLFFFFLVFWFIVFKTGSLKLRPALLHCCLPHLYSAGTTGIILSWFVCLFLWCKSRTQCRACVALVDLKSVVQSPLPQEQVVSSQETPCQSPSHRQWVNSSIVIWNSVTSIPKFDPNLWLSWGQLSEEAKITLQSSHSCFMRHGIVFEAIRIKSS